MKEKAEGQAQRDAVALLSREALCSITCSHRSPLMTYLAPDCLPPRVLVSACCPREMLPARRVVLSTVRGGLAVWGRGWEDSCWSNQTMAFSFFPFLSACLFSPFAFCWKSWEEDWKGELCPSAQSDRPFTAIRSKHCIACEIYLFHVGQQTMLETLLVKTLWILSPS